MSSIFISYSRKDEVFARRLAASLSDMGVDVWIDVDDIPVGKKWSSAIQRGLDSADLMILVISPDSMASQNVEDEWQYFLDNGKTVVPVLARPTKIHFQLNRVQYVDFNSHEYPLAFEQLVRKLGEQGLRLGADHSPDRETIVKPTQASSARATRLWIAGGLMIILIAAVLLIFRSPSTATSTEQTLAAQNTQIVEVRLTNAALSVVTETFAAIIPLIQETVATSATPAVEPRVTAKDDTSVHSGDGSGFPTFARLAKGENALALGVGLGGYYIELTDGRRGWVCKDCVDLNVPFSSLTFVDDEELPTSTPTQGS